MEIQSVKNIFNYLVIRLSTLYNERESKNIAWKLLGDVFNINKSEILLGNTCAIDKKKMEVCVQRLLNHEPIQYVTGVADFFGRSLYVNPHVFIPRPETEELVQLVIDENKSKCSKLLDICTGSGAIAITLYLEMGGEVLGTDCSVNTLQVAKKNMELLQSNVTWNTHDILLSPLNVENLDVLVCNPPYIPHNEYQNLLPNVRNFEPSIALFVSDEDPLIFYKVVANKALKALKKGGKMYFEIHENYGDQIINYLSQLPYKNIVIFKDMQKKNRMIRAIKK